MHGNAGSKVMLENFISEGFQSQLHFSRHFLPGSCRSLDLEASMVNCDQVMFGLSSFGKRYQDFNHPIGSLAEYYKFDDPDNAKAALRDYAE